MSTKKALKNLLIWIALALLFNACIYIFQGPQKALSFLGGYVIEQSLSLDNLFLFLLIFESFSISPRFQKRILSYGIIGAIVLRLLFIVLGVSIINKFHWILYIFGITLMISGFKMIFIKDNKRDFKRSNILIFLNKIIPVSDELDGEKFFIKKNKILHATPLFAVLILIEISDIIFAVDSIPAVFSITTDPLIVYTSNIFAILGLRSMYFLLQKVHNKFEYVKYGVALVLIFTGIKLSVAFFHISISIPLSLSIIFVIISVSIFFSIAASKRSLTRDKFRNIT